MAHSRRVRLAKRRKAEKARRKEKTRERVSFLDLAGEIRNCIYREALVYIYKDKPRPGDQCVRSLKQHPLALVSKQVRHESLDIFYGENHFVLAIPSREARARKPPREPLAGFIVDTMLPSSKTSLKYLSSIQIVSQCYGDYFKGKGGFCMSIEEHKLGPSRRRIGDDKLDWRIKKRVENAYIAALEPGVRKKSMDEEDWKMYRVLCAVAERYPQLTKWVSLGC
ncbi:hypothetical protein N0V93_001322 [Gnomoniopsis smithogilvyi]|uniref:Uncharacterized protein n=1 Tax=Gnomoniopsis smithogilvyi TaxID=1191159 RepID=A0A9W9D1J4_9PEZI|nr:hypothetical protein N0V93_001322 [Gnomoniopsis smithogilvyi]